jgi:large repetitive protein
MSNNRLSSKSTRWLRILAVLSMLLGMLPSMAPAGASADNVVNSLNSTSGGIVNYTVGNTPVSVEFKITGAGNNCLATSSVPAVFRFTSTPTGAVALPALIQFPTCNLFVTAQFVAPAAGDYAISMVYVSGIGGAQAYTVQGGFTLHVTAADTTAPVVNVSGPQYVEATSSSGAVVTYTASANDNLDGAITPTCSKASGTLFPLGQTTVTCSATDAHNNTGSNTYTVTVRDTTAPVIASHANLANVEATGPNGAIVTYTAPSTSDAVSGSGTTSCSPASGTMFGLGPNTITCSAQDAAGNAATQTTFTVAVVDTTGPVISDTPTDFTVEATGPSGAVATYDSPTAVDLVTGPVPVVSCSPASGSTFAIGATAVSCSASDGNGNSSSSTFKVVVLDSTAPVLSLPGNMTEEATSAAGANVTFAASASDLVDGDITPVCAPTSGSAFGLDTTTTVSCSAEDNAANTATGSFTVSIVDTTAPVIASHANLADVEATGPGGAAVTYTAPSTSDAVDGPGTASCSPASGTVLGIGEHTISCSATDAHGNAAQGTSFKVKVVDTTAPVITNTPANIVAEATGPSGAVVNYTSPTASDIVDGNMQVLCLAASGSTFALGTTTVSCTATDAHNNSRTTNFTITVRDTTAPVLSLPDDITAEATSGAGVAVPYTTSANDAVSGPVATTCLPAPGSTFALGTTAVSCSATDNAGNPATHSFNVLVQDTTAPALTLPANMTAEATGSNGAAVTYTASASDLVDGARSVNCSPASGSTFALGTTTVNCSATDTHNNTANGSFTVTVQDTTGPAITGVPANITTGPTNGTGATVTYTAPSAADLVDGVRPVGCLPASGTQFSFGTTTVNCASTDSRGNTSDASFTVTVSSFTFTGFFQPVDNFPTVNTLRGGSTVPIKWQLRGQGGTLITTTDSVMTGWPKLFNSTACNGAYTDEIEVVTSGSTTLRYDATAQQFIYNWKTPSGAGCYRLEIKFADGTIQNLLFKTR